MNVKGINVLLGFNSLQTGKPIQRKMARVGPRSLSKVSIPFKRESLSKEYNATLNSVRNLTGFQFPSNGKAYPKPTGNSVVNSSDTSFNSLQTGKPIQSGGYEIAITATAGVVSIPFKRESLSKVSHYEKLVKVDIVVSIPFKRESLSKAIIAPTLFKTLNLVSIPFKRESLSKAIGTLCASCA